MAGVLPAARLYRDAVYDVHPFELKQRRHLPACPLAITMRWHGVTTSDTKSGSAEAPIAAGAGVPHETAPPPDARSRCTPNVVRTLGCLRTGVSATPYCGEQPSALVRCSQGFLPNARVRKDILPRGSTRYYNVNFSQDGDLIVIGAQDEHISLVDSATLKTVKDVIANDIAWAVTSVDVSPDGQFLIYSSMHDVIHLTNVHGPTALHDAMPLSTGSRRPFGVYQARFSAGGNEIIAGCSNKCILVYDVERKRRVEKFAAHDDDINSVAFADMSFRSNILLSGSDDRFIKVWDRREPATEDGTRTPSGVLAGHMEGITCVNSRGDGVYAVSNGKDQCAKLWDLRKMSATTDVRSLSARSSFDFDYRWQTYPGSEHPPTRHPHDTSVMTYRGHAVLQTLIRCNFSPMSTTAQKYIYSGSADGKIYIYEVLTGEIVSVLSGHTGTVRDVSWHPKLPLLASASFDKHVSLWSYREDKQDLDRIRSLGRRRNQLRCRAANRQRRALSRPSGMQSDAVHTDHSAPVVSSPPSTRGRRRTGLFDDYGTAVATAGGVGNAAALLYEADDFDEGDPSCDTTLSIPQLSQLAREDLDTDEDEAVLDAPQSEQSEQDMSPQQMLSIMRAIAAQFRNARAHGPAEPSDDVEDSEDSDYVGDTADDEDEDDEEEGDEQEDEDLLHED